MGSLHMQGTAGEERKGQLSREAVEEALTLRHGRTVQEKLKAGKVAVAGLGGLGSNVAFSLARIGVGSLHLIDFDRVDVTNLNRQQYRMCHVGRYKTEALKEELLEINPYLEIRTDCVRMTEENLGELFREDEIICEAFDDPECKAILVNGVLETFPEKVVVSASGMAGYGRSNEIRTRKVTEHFYLCGDEVSDSQEEPGLMAPRVAICAGHEANLIAELLIRRRDNDGGQTDIKEEMRRNQK
ncbi:sulfur carrier protein ThiS adenylyltransferase ThiF [uncultured Merdimonas sp.]|uniref:sulfur carrier protein ThiS adenylyltransferase ThiF n=1 Tax=uncultured Merdimonas sp. TaxID=2023269 RepID=UPI0032099469